MHTNDDNNTKAKNGICSGKKWAEPNPKINKWTRRRTNSHTCTPARIFNGTLWQEILFIAFRSAILIHSITSVDSTSIRRDPNWFEELIVIAIRDATVTVMLTTKIPQSLSYSLLVFAAPKLLASLFAIKSHRHLCQTILCRFISQMPK